MQRERLKEHSFFSWQEHCKIYLTRVAACRMRHPQWQIDTPADESAAEYSLNDSLKVITDMSLRLSIDGDKTSLNESLNMAASGDNQVQDQRWSTRKEDDQSGPDDLEGDQAGCTIWKTVESCIVDSYANVRVFEALAQRKEESIVLIQTTNSSGVIEHDVKSSNSPCLLYVIKDLSKAIKVDDLRQKLRMRGLRGHLMYCRNSTRMHAVPLLASRSQALRYPILSILCYFW
ncbi:hypothetical protein SASPL_150206 [Salvia splendens]|uniref:Uncharacterized protein n=1 Tax=Salvia splendens TaxID=180675 RepID=A0A8X8W714_SALSN|nr:hypothetical protein SASPL_150206 [Salvia splendens]